MTKIDISKALQAGNALRSASGRRSPVVTGNVALDRLTTAVWLGQQGKEWYDKAGNWYRGKTTWTITLEETDTSYVIVQQWLLDTIPQAEQKSLTATSKTVFSGREEDELDPLEAILSSRGAGSKASETRIALSVGDIRAYQMDIGGHKVTVNVSHITDDGDEGGGRPRPPRSKGLRSGRIVFYTRSVEAQDAVIAQLDKLVSRQSKKKPSLWIADGWGSWRSQDAPARKMSSVILRDGLKEDIIADLQKFLDDEQKYVDLGISWHRGYLLHGPPGTGKSSLIKALATEMGLDLWYAPLGDLKEDSSLVDLVRSVNSRGILLLEDIDAYQAAKKREDGDSKDYKGISSTALFNALDGVVTPHGLITIMTTNHIDQLDPAMVRSGRADMVIELGLPSVAEISQLWSMFFPAEENWIIPRDEVPGLSQAQVSEVFKSNWDNPAVARKELLAALVEAKA